MGKQTAKAMPKSHKHKTPVLRDVNTIVSGGVSTSSKKHYSRVILSLKSRATKPTMAPSLCF